MTGPRYGLRLTPAVRRALDMGLPEAVAVAAWEFMDGPLRANPRRVGKPLRPPLEGTWSARRGTYRLLYEIDEDDRVVTVTAVARRADSYRTR